MYRTLFLLGTIVLPSFVATGGMADERLQEDICRARAVEISGYKGLAPKQKRVTASISGSAAVGVATRSGAPTNRPERSGAAAQERQDRQDAEAKEDRARQAYQKAYDTCMSNAGINR